MLITLRPAPPEQLATGLQGGSVRALPLLMYSFYDVSTPVATILAFTKNSHLVAIID